MTQGSGFILTEVQKEELIVVFEGLEYCSGDKQETGTSAGCSDMQNQIDGPVNEINNWSKMVCFCKAFTASA